MSLEIVRAGDEHREMWDAFVRARPDSTHYHLYPWRWVFSRTYGHCTHYLMALDSGELQGVLPLLEVRSRWGSYLSSLPGGPCSVSGAPLEALLAEALSLTHRLRLPCLQLRELRERYDRAALQTRRTEQTYVVRLPETSDELWRSIRGGARRAVRKARKSGVRVLGGPAPVASFYPIYARNMRDLGTPAIPKRFFLEATGAFPDSVLPCVAQDRSGRTVAGMILGVTNRWKTELLFAASMNRFQHVRPNDLLYWEALRRCIDDGFEVFDMGRSEAQSGAARFKEKWGAEPEPLYYQFYSRRRSAIVADPRRDWRYKVVQRVWRRLPLSVATRLAGPVRRFIPLG